MLAFQPCHAVVVIGTDAHAQDALALSAPHGQQAVRRAASEGFAEVEIVGIFGGLVGLGLGFHHARGDDGLATEGESHLVARLLVLAHHLGNDVLGAFQGGVHVGHAVFHKPAGGYLRLWLAL